MAVPSLQPDNENTAYEALRAHQADCLECNPGEGLLCRRGGVLHRRWAAAQEEQREERG